MILALMVLFILYPSNGFKVSPLSGHNSPDTNRVQRSLLQPSLPLALSSLQPKLISTPSLLMMRVTIAARNTIIDSPDATIPTMDDKGPGTSGATIKDTTPSSPSTANKNVASSSRLSLSEAIQDAAAAFTQESCHLLGIKSLGVDYGLVRTGIAVTVGYNPQPLEILVVEPPESSSRNDSDIVVTNNDGRTIIAQRVTQIASREQVQQIIVGLPLHKNGTDAEQTHLTRAFASELAVLVLKELGPNIPVLLWDERYTSKEAAARAHSKDPNRDLYGTLDADAACIILENFYNDNGHARDGQVMEYVTINDPSLVEQYTAEWEERQRQRAQQVHNALLERDARLRWRRGAIERDRQQQQQQHSDDGGGCTTKKKKKKKKKK